MLPPTLIEAIEEKKGTGHGAASKPKGFSQKQLDSVTTSQRNLEVRTSLEEPRRSSGMPSPPLSSLSHSSILINTLLHSSALLSLCLHFVILCGLRLVGKRASECSCVLEDIMPGEHAIVIEFIEGAVAT